MELALCTGEMSCCSLGAEKASAGFLMLPCVWAHTAHSAVSLSRWASWEYECPRPPLADQADFLLAPHIHTWDTILGSYLPNVIGLCGFNSDNKESFRGGFLYSLGVLQLLPFTIVVYGETDFWASVQSVMNVEDEIPYAVAMPNSLNSPTLFLKNWTRPKGSQQMCVYKKTWLSQ